MNIKDISLEQRPRERLLENGASNLSDAELLALLLEKGSIGENVIDLSHRLISSYGLESLNSLSVAELTKLKGIGVAKACKVMAAFELSKRVNSGKIIGKEISSASDVFSYYKEKLGSLKKEHFYALLLDSKNRIIKEELISVGTLNASLVHPREVFKAAIKESANTIILVHNHPSGDVTPSEADEQIADRFNDSGKLLKIKVKDHVIIGKENYYSFKEKGILI
jgi:DNA repair protein RadC